MFLTDYLPSLRAALPAAVRAGLAGDGAPLARLIRESRRFEDLGSARDFSVARYATVCETTPLPWDPGTPIEQRRAVAQQRIAAVPPAAFAPFDPAVVVEDEINLCLRWPDVPRPAAPPAGPYPAVPTLILQGGEDLRTPPEWSARLAARIPGAQRLVVPGVGHSAVSDPRGCAARAIVRFARGASVPTRCGRVRTGVPAVAAAPEAFDSLPGYGTLPRKIGRTVRALAASFDDLRLVLSPAVLVAAGGGLRGGTWEVRGSRLVLRDFEAVTGVTLNGGGGRALTVRVTGSKAASGTVTLRSRGRRLTGRLDGRPISGASGGPAGLCGAIAGALTAVARVSPCRGRRTAAGEGGGQPACPRSLARACAPSAAGERVVFIRISDSETPRSAARVDFIRISGTNSTRPTAASARGPLSDERVDFVWPSATNSTRPAVMSAAVPQPRLVFRDANNSPGRPGVDHRPHLPPFADPAQPPEADHRPHLPPFADPAQPPEADHRPHLPPFADPAQPPQGRPPPRTSPHATYVRPTCPAAPSPPSSRPSPSPPAAPSRSKPPAPTPRASPTQCPTAATSPPAPTPSRARA